MTNDTSKFPAIRYVVAVDLRFTMLRQGTEQRSTQVVEVRDFLKWENWTLGVMV